MNHPDDFALDGNAVAGPLSEIFGVDVTSIRVTCEDCGATAPLARVAAYVRGPGSVLRCRSCTSVIGRFARSRDSIWLDLRGSTSWQLRATS
ncbi:DUF6510 family protein [Nocardioides sp. YIM 152315]|uniref:DUF6510 family protein n=1 Tax=Nocardioides sp. YIM 152315 TaxID=3031760 RepID=UPI0023DAD4FD|nr:DUF6510 family protein [Nocardioides sp. YIM 152315]MDF1606331.1 DUF6510 family protein [Nocardioides sp. YIM 152315]